MLRNKNKYLQIRENTFPLPFSRLNFILATSLSPFSIYVTTDCTLSRWWCGRQCRNLFLLLLVSHCFLLTLLPSYSFPLLWCVLAMGHSLSEEELAPMWVIQGLQSLWGCYSLWNAALLLCPFLSVHCLFLNTFSQRHCKFCWWAQLCPVGGLLWSHL